MIDQLLQLGIADGAIQQHGIPVFLVHVIAGRNKSELIAQFHGPFGVAFQVNAGKGIYIRQGKDLTAYLENEGILAKGHILRYPGLVQAIIPEFFDVHRKNIR
jgi:hypothetical protein